mmetsp:Transcript_75900/g.180375  ORF Transcript_75900/g.180375 Transcript_75900/m.180375 type:complete len:632 (+) Transcript_75900:90-1985(+)
MLAVGVNHWPLTHSDKEQFDKLRTIYDRRRIECLIDLDVECEKGWLFEYYRAKQPATDRDLSPLPANLSQFGFLSYQAQSMHATLYALMQSTYDALGDHGLHLPAVVVALEFQRWVGKIGLLAHADSDTSAEISRRIQLIDDLQLACDHRMAEHLRLLQTLGAVRGTLHSMLAKWGFYEAQETIQENLRGTWQDIAQVLRSLLVYLFYVLRGDSIDLSFDPSTFAPAPAQSGPEGHHSDTGKRKYALISKVMQRLLADYYVRLVVTQEEGSMQPLSDKSEGFPRLDREEGRHTLEALVGLKNCPLSKIAAEHEDSGFVAPQDCGVADFEAVVECWLRLHTRAAALARCVKLMKSAHKLASLGGEQLLALLAQTPANKSLVDNVFTFARKELEQTMKECELLHNMLLQGHLVMKTGVNWFTNYGFERWSRYFSFANKYRENIGSSADSAMKAIDRLSERVSKLSGADIQKQLDTEARYFQMCAVATLADFGDNDEVKSVDPAKVLLADIHQPLYHRARAVEESDRSQPARLALCNSSAEGLYMQPGVMPLKVTGRGLGQQRPFFLPTWQTSSGESAPRGFEITRCGDSGQTIQRIRYLPAEDNLRTGAPTPLVEEYDTDLFGIQTPRPQRRR